jgi:hypothetical protein
MLVINYSPLRVYSATAVLTRIITIYNNRLLQPEPSDRLGSKPGDISLLKTHQWFAGFDWGGVSRGEYFNQELRQVSIHTLTLWTDR